MPLIKRAIEPEELSRTPLPAKVDNELECVANNTLSNVIRQLSSLARHAEDMFQELSCETRTLFSRSMLLQSRVDRLQEKVQQLDATGEEVLLQDVAQCKQFHSSQRADQQVVSRSSLPVAVVQRYQSCEPPPALNKLNQYRDDGRDCMKFFTDPDYFAELWLDETKKENEKLKRRLKSKHRQLGPVHGQKNKQIRIRQQKNNQDEGWGAEFTADKRRQRLEKQRQDELSRVGVPASQTVSQASLQQTARYAADQRYPQDIRAATGHSIESEQMVAYADRPASRYQPSSSQSYKEPTPQEMRASSADPPFHEPSHYFTTEDVMRPHDPAQSLTIQGMQRYHSVNRPAQPPPPVPMEQTSSEIAQPIIPPAVSSPPPVNIPDYTPVPALQHSPQQQKPFQGYHQNTAAVSPPPPFVGLDIGPGPANVSRDSMELPPPPTPPEMLQGSPVGIPAAPSPPPMLEPSIVAPPPLPIISQAHQASPPLSTPKPTDARSELLAAIQQGAKLRRVAEQRNRVEQRRPTLGGIDVAAMMDRAVELRRKAISDSETDSDDGADWEDDVG